MNDLKTTCLNTLLTSNLLITLHDELQGTDMYRHKLKHGLKTAVAELEIICNKGFKDISGKGDNFMYDIMEAQKNLIGEIARLKPYEYQLVAEQLKKFNDTSDNNTPKEG